MSKKGESDYGVTGKSNRVHHREGRLGHKLTRMERERTEKIRTCCFSPAISAVNYLKPCCVLQGMVYKFILHKGTRWLQGSLHCSSNHLRCKASIQCAKQKLTESLFLNVFQFSSFFFSFFPPTRCLLGSLRKNTAHAQQYL